MIKIIKQLTLLLIVLTITSVSAQWRNLNNSKVIEKSPSIQRLNNTVKNTIIIEIAVYFCYLISKKNIKTLKLIL